MALVQVTEANVAFGTRVVLEAASMSANENEIVGLIGANGCGKTTLLRLIAGTATADSGRIDRKRGLRIGFLEQEPALPEEVSLHDAAMSAFAELLEIEKRMREIEHEIATADPARRKELLKQLGQLQERFEHAGGYEQESRAGTVLHGLGFMQEEFEKPVAVLSGGERTRLALARLLLREADLLLLDEPTNHLDLAGIEWLETYLQKKFRGAALVVSHDRLFLDRTVRKIIELEDAKLEEYPGNYTSFAETKALRRAEQQRLFEQQQQFIAKEEDFIRRYHYAQRSAQARGRQTRLDRLERREAPVQQKSISISFDAKKSSGDLCLSVEDLAKRFGERTLFSELSFDVYRGDCVGIIGPNGSGKSTLLRLLLQQDKAEEGTVKVGRSVHFGYLEQHMENLSDDRTVLDEVWERNRKLTELEVRRVLGRFLFGGDETLSKRMSQLSGGERTRVALACLMIERPNVLVLDEPTNHLDIASCEALEDALADYDGALVVVSHDRYFINNIVDRLLVLDKDGGRPMTVLGNYEAYEKLRDAASRTAPASPSHAAPRRAPAPTPSKPKKSKYSKNRLARLEEDIARLEDEKTRLEVELAKPELYSDAAKAREVPRRYEEVCGKLETLYQEWTKQEEA